MDNMSFEELQQIVSVCLDEIISLKEDNAKLRENNTKLVGEIKNIAISMNSLLKGQKELVDNVRILDNSLDTHSKITKCTIDNLKYEFNDPKLDKQLCYYPSFYDIEETIKCIIEKHCSMARFGDGEFAIMSNVIRQKFQHLDDKLATRLKEVININEEGFLVGIADNYGALDKYNEGGKLGIRYYMTDEVREQHAQFIDVSRIYHNAYISRPYALFADNMSDAPRKRFDALKRIWAGRDVVFVEGSMTRLGVGNDLFDNALRIRRIEAPPTNSYDKYDEILCASLECAQEDTLFLIALGPSAGVLAYDLYKAGYQALDIGHVDLEYEWFLNGKGMRSEVKHKYNNEFPGGDIVENIQDEEYLKQIIKVIK